MRVAFVVAVAEDGVIGAAGALPWRISDDLKWFRKVTLGKPVVMGRKTYESIGKPLPGRDNIVITREPAWRADGVIRAGTISEALRIAAARAAARGADEICVIGGAEIFEQTLPFADRIYLTRVEAAIEGDAYFPLPESEEWLETPAGGCQAGPKNQFSCRFFILDRRSGAPQ